MKEIMESKTPTFQQYFQAAFKRWENEQPSKRASISAFARWLSENNYDVVIKQQLASDWYYGKYKPSDDKYLLVLEEKIGNDIYDILGIEKPNPYLQTVNSRWQFISEERQKQIAELIIKYETENISERIHRTSEQGKTRRSK